MKSLATLKTLLSLDQTSLTKPHIVDDNREHLEKNEAFSTKDKSPTGEDFTLADGCPVL